MMAEGAGFEPAAHGVGAGFQDRWFQPLTHPSEKENQLLTSWPALRENPCCNHVAKFQMLLQRRRV